MRRRTKGEGTVFEQRPGYWVAQVREAGHRYSGSGRTAIEARRAVAAKVAEAERRRLERIEDQQLLAGYLGAWLAETKHTLKPAAWRRYASIVNVHLVSRLGHLRLGELTRAHLTEFYEDLRTGKHGRALSDTSCHHIHATLRKALEDAVDQGLLAVNVAKRYPAPRMTHRPKVILDRGQVGALLRAAVGDPLEALYVLAVTTGMREGELLGLRWRHVDLDAATVKVFGTATRGYDGVLTVGDPKTRGSTRTVALSGRAVDALRRRQVFWGKPAPDRLVFARAGDDDRPLDGGNMLRDSFHPLLARAGLPMMPFHDLRHSAITLLLEAGVAPHAVADQAGHSDVATTLRIYGHVTPRMRGEVATVMQGLLAGTPA